MADPDEPLTPAGRLFVQPLMDQIINSSVALQNPIDADAIKAAIGESIMVRHPRFCSLMVRDAAGREHWRRTPVDVDRHVIVRDAPLSDDPSVSDEDAVSDYIADLTVSSPLAADKPLWEVHLLRAHRTAVFRVHHALGDGISLMSLMLSCCRRADDPSKVPTIGGVGASSAPPPSTPERRKLGFWTAMMMVWYTLVYVLEFLSRALWRSDEPTAIIGGAGVELWPRKLATARFRLDDMKIVKRVVENATINDVLFGIISCGLSRYLDMTSPQGQGLKDGVGMTGLAMVNLRAEAGLQDVSKLMDGKSKIRWGNKFGMLLLPIYYHKTDFDSNSDPIEFVRRAKAMIDKKKLSLEAPFSYALGNLVMSLFGAKIASILNYRIVCNTSFTLSNVVGPREEITMVGNPVRHLRATSSTLPHALTMHMVSYAGNADLQILVAKDIIADPKVVAKCFQDSLLQMKQLALQRTNSKS
ncbi:wax ester synthase/diacylglycerol acyltransferase 11-like isoform X2 [Andrographis paniculata]|uniref:wax ester synthase/diacylglycerol acyltransferase 11-like isoform X2 n=1 Tax=Andrographis paniculata TaxID=175694 RepID=UPI0021E8D19D|nr:wax ester synthase/diacylglycerol acyltransferase 11-like isoform X2 [Andrographis paniculata]